MFRFLSRRRRRPEDAPGAADRGASPEHPPGAAGARQPQPEEFSSPSRHRRPGQGWAWPWRQDGTWHSPGAGHTGRNAGTPGEVGDSPGCAPVNGKDPRGRQNGGARQEQPEVGSGPGGTQALGKDFGDEPGVPRQARNGNVPREGTDRPRRRAPLPPRAGNREDEEGEPCSNSRSRDKDKDSATCNGNVPRGGTDQPVCVPTFWVVGGEDEEGKPRNNSQSRGRDTGKDKDSATRNGNVLREGTDRPRRRAPLPPRAGNREDEEGEPCSNSRSRDKDKDSATALQNGNVPREGMGRPVPLPSAWVAKREDEEGEPRSNSQSRDKDKDTATRNGNVLREGTDRPRRRAPAPPPLPPRAGRREDEEGEPSSNSRSRDMGTATQNGNVPREGMDRPVCVPSVWAVSREDEEGEPSSNSQSRDTDKDSATQNGNVLREGTDRPRCRVLSPLPPWAGSREDEEGEPSSNSRSRGRDTDKGSALCDGNVPREGMDQPVCVPTFWFVSGEDEEGEPSSNSRSRGRDTAAATTPGRDRRTEAPSGAERRERLWQRLLQLGEDMEHWEGKPTAELAAGLARRIAATPLGSYPEGPGGTRSARRERSSGARPDCGTPGGNYQSLLGMPRASGNAENAEEDSGSGSDQEPGSRASPDHDNPSGNYEIFLGMLRASGNAESAEEDSGWERSSGASPDCDVPSGNNEIFLGMLRASGNAESAEEDSGLEQEQEQEQEQEWEQEQEQEWEQEQEQEWEQEWEQEQEQEQVQVAVNVVQPPSRLELRFPEVWARSRLDCGRVAEEELLDGAPVPFQRQRRLHPDEERQMAELLQEYLEQGIVVEGTSKSNNPLILYQKSHGRGVRLSLECAALNDATPVKPQESLDKKRFLTSINPRSRFFSVLDLSNACLAIPLAPECWHRFAFTFQGQQFLFTRLPPKFRGTISILHRRVAAMLARLDPDVARGVFHYSDDILITGKCRRQLRFRTRRVLQLIQNTGFKVNRDKAQLVQTKVNYLGMTLSAAGRRVSHEKLQEICQGCDAPKPWDAARLRSVLGKFEDLKEFIADYLELVLPLRSLAVPEKWEGERERQWQQEWEREGREQLRRLKEALKAAPALLFPNKSRPFVIRLSVHERSVGAVLLQEKEGALLPVQHCSHKLGGQGLTPQDASCLAAVRAVQAFQKLTGPAPILIRGPAGRYLLRGEPLLDGCSGDSELPERWRLLVTTKGPERQESQTVPIPLARGLQESQWLSIPLAPALRQLPADVPKANVWFLAVEKGSSGKQSVAFAATSLEERWLLGLRQGPEEEEAVLEALKELLEQHRSCRPLFLYSSWPTLAPRLKQRSQSRHCGQGVALTVLDRLRSFPGMLQVRQVGMHGNTAPDERRWVQEVTARAKAVAENPVDSWKVWEPSASERQEIVAQCHRRCHDGVRETLRRVQRVRSWRNVHEDAARWVRRCPRCQDGNPSPNPDPAPQRERGPWSRLRLSLSTALPQSPEGFRALLLVQDELSGWLDAFPLREPARPEVTQVLLREVFGRFGKVNTVLLEPKPAWLSELLQQPPLLGWYGRLERVEPAEAALGMVRVARALGKEWAAALPLIRAGIAAPWVREEELGALLCVPGLPLEVRREYPGCGKGNGKGDGKENELRRLRAMKIVEGFRQKGPFRSDEALSQDWGTFRPGRDFRLD